MLERLAVERAMKAPPRAVKRVLIVEDNPLNMKLFSAMLTAEGYQVLQAVDGGSGLGLARETHPDLIIMDVNLPEMSGLEVARRLKADESTRDIAIVVTTAFRERDDAEIASIGCDGFMAKPIGVSEFLETVGSVMMRAAGARPYSA